jgi:uncharacterized protein YciW
MTLTPWQRAQYRRLRALLDHAETLADEPKRKLGYRLIQITAAVDALIRPTKSGGNHAHVAGLISELETKHLN